MTDITCRPIVVKDGQVFTGIAQFEGGVKIYRFSNSVYDSKRYKSIADAQRWARKIGGVVKLFDALNGEMI